MWNLIRLIAGSERVFSFRNLVAISHEYEIDSISTVGGTIRRVPQVDQNLCS